tara:strand:- start:84 stop:911 length:828 start_codon:yes stop_codon:yes gene_type:complete
MNNIFLKYWFLSLFLFLFCHQVFAEVLIQDDFSSKKLKGYDKSHIAKNKKDFKSYEFLVEKNGNVFVRLSSRVGQLSKFNKGSKYIKDRIELGTKYRTFPDTWKKIENKTYSWSFDIKLPKSNLNTNANHITITQLKTIEQNNKNKQCHPGMPFRINFHNKKTWIAVTDGFNRKYNKKYFYENFLNENWTNFKIEYHFSKNEGFVNVFKNDKLIFDYFGNTMFTEYKDCKPVSKLITYIRIGVYRQTPSENTRFDSIDFDNFIICEGSLKRCNLI